MHPFPRFSLASARPRGFARLGSLWLALVLLFGAGASPAAARVYDLDLGDSNNRTLRLNMPDGVPVVKGLLIWGNGWNSDLRAMATDPEFVAFGESMEFATLAMSRWTEFAYGPTPSEYSRFMDALQRLANMSGHPELVRVPWLPVGQSNGGSISYQLNVFAPEKTLAIATNKGRYYTPRPDVRTLRTPGLLVGGEADLPERNTAQVDAFYGNRPRGALWAWVEEQATNHVTGDTFELILPFAAEVARLRYPWSAPSSTGTVTLIDLPEESGWLVEPESFRRGLAQIAPYATYTGDRSRAGWLPNRRLAFIFRAFASYRLGKFEAYLDSGTGPVDWGTRVNYSLAKPLQPWSSVEFYEGDTLLKRVTAAEGGLLSVDAYATRAGYCVYHSLITFTDGSQSSSMPRRVFVRAGPRDGLAGTRTVEEGGRAEFHVPERPSAVYQWQASRGAAWENLVDGAGPGTALVSGTRTPSLVLESVGLAASGFSFRCLVNGTATADAPLSVFPRGTLAITRAAPLFPVPAGTEVTLSADATAYSDCQWYLDGAPIPGATSATLQFRAGAVDAGTYSLVARSVMGMVSRVDAGTLAVHTEARLFNLSARARTDAGADVLTAGFVTNDLPGAPGKAMRVRGSGPSLSAPPASLSGALPAGTLRLYDISRTVLRSQALGSAPLEMDPVLSPGAYTVQLGADGPGGIGLLELFDPEPGWSSRRLINLSARARVGAGNDVLIGGFIITGATAKTVLIRAVGQGLRNLVSGYLTKPVLTLYDADRKVIVRNTGYDQPAQWGDSSVPAGVAHVTEARMARAGANLLPQPHLTGYDSGYDSALIVTLPPGGYTAHASSATGETGVALMEIYEVP